MLQKYVLVVGADWHPSMVKRGGGTLGISQPSKRAKWKDMVSLKNVTDSALSAISKALERQGAGENISRTMLSRMVHEEYQKFAWAISLPQEQAEMILSGQFANLIGYCNIFLMRLGVISRTCWQAHWTIVEQRDSLWFSPRMK